MFPKGTHGRWSVPQRSPSPAVRASAPRPPLPGRAGRRAAVLAAVVLAFVVATVAGGSRAGIDFRSSFDNGTIAPWTSVQHVPGRPLADSFGLTSSPVRSGAGAAGFTVRQGYSDFGYDEATLLCCGPQPYEQEGSDYWYAWSTLFAPPWREPYRWGIFAQWHSKYGLPPPLDFNVGATSIWVQLHTGAVQLKPDRWSYERSIRIVRGVAPGTWHDFVVHVQWSAFARGSVTVWHRLAGEAHFKRVLRLTRVPTLQRLGAEISPNYTLLGMYRGSYCSRPVKLGCTSPLGVQPETVVYHDEFRRSTTMFSWCRACSSSLRATGSSATPNQ